MIVLVVIICLVLGAIPLAVVGLAMAESHEKLAKSRPPRLPRLK